MTIDRLQTPALLVEKAALEENLRLMSAALPGARLRPHVKAHKSTALAKLQAAAGHRHFTCATIREVEGMAAAGLGEDLLLANEVLDATRLGLVVTAGARVTVAVDSRATVEAASAGGIHEVIVDVNVGLPRCGCAPEDAGRIADLARASGLAVRGVMGYEGHVVAVPDVDARRTGTEECMARLLAAHELVGGDIVSAGGTGTYAVNTWANEIQAGSYVLMDTAYGALPDLPFAAALSVLGTVISTTAPAGEIPGWAVVDVGLKSLGMDQRQPDDPRRHGVVLLRRAHDVATGRLRLGVGRRQSARAARARRPDGRAARADVRRRRREGRRHAAGRPPRLVGGAARLARHVFVASPSPCPPRAPERRECGEHEGDRQRHKYPKLGRSHVEGGGITASWKRAVVAPRLQHAV